MSAITIRRAASADAETLARLCLTVQQLHHEQRPGLFKPAQLDAALIALYRDWAAKPEAAFFIAEIDSRPAGYAYTLIVERPENPFTYAMRVLLVDQFSVNPEFQSRGCGQALMQAVYDHARGQNIGRVILGVWAFNERAIRFYEKQGFTIYDQRMERGV